MSVIDPSSVPPSPQAAGRDQLSGHEYDGIQEYDNPTPGWWVAVFAATVVFSVFYFVSTTAASPSGPFTTATPKPRPTTPKRSSPASASPS